jgi:glycosyltransferase involved in cell wall biosynthesis
LKNKTIFYWSPFLTEIATIKSVINSAYSLKKFSDNYNVSIIDAGGEFQDKKVELLKKKIELIKLSNVNYIKYLPKYGKIYSRISFILIFIFSFYSLKETIKKKKPDYILIHLITSLPLILFYFFNFDTKCILRISGYPKIGKLRFFFWKFILEKIYLITCPTLATYDYLKKLNIVPEYKLRVLRDPIINVRESIKSSNVKSGFYFKNYAIAIGRLTQQKNFIFLINSYKRLEKEFPNLNLIIIGNGEDKKMLNRHINSLSLQSKIKILEYQKNIFPYLKNAEFFVMPSLWEDPGFVLLESALMRCFVITSNCKNGPEEIIKHNNAGLLFEKNNIDDFIKKIKFFKALNEIQKKNYKLNALRACRSFTLFSHSIEIRKILK